MITVQHRHWKGVGETLASPPARMYLTGRLTVECGDALLDQRALPGRQGRLALTYLALTRTRPVPRDELIVALWPEAAPASVDTALSAVVSKLRGSMTQLGLPADVLTANAGCYQLRLPPGSIIDIETAANRLDRAEGALRADDLGAAWSGATVATAILRRPLLPGDDAPWLTGRRTDLRDMLLRAYDCLTEVWLRRGDTTLATAAARDALAIAPLRESGYRRLMRVHVAAGERGEALRLYDHLRGLLRDELGVSPSPETQALFADLLAGG
jgi:SARP family transcriptional regulator, regulator of embCAB operon